MRNTFLLKIIYIAIALLATVAVFGAREKIAVFIPPVNADAMVQRGNYYFNVGLPAQAGGSGAYDLDKAEKYF